MWHPKVLNPSVRGKKEWSRKCSIGLWAKCSAWFFSNRFSDPKSFQRRWGLKINYWLEKLKNINDFAMAAAKIEFCALLRTILALEKCVFAYFCYYWHLLLISRIFGYLLHKSSSILCNSSIYNFLLGYYALTKNFIMLVLKMLAQIKIFWIISDLNYCCF